MMNGANTSIVALETKVGVDSSAVATSLDYKLTNASSSNPGHKHTLAQGATDVTSSAAELNVLDGIPGTLTATELGYVDGVTSAIQTQLDAKAPLVSPSFTTPSLGVATATSINKVTITQPATAATLTLTNNKTLSVSNTLTLAGTDSTTITFQATDTYVGRATTDTLTNKRITRRVLSTNAPGATPTLNTDNYDAAHFTGLSTAITSMTTNLSGTPVQGDVLRIDFTDDGTARAITWGTSFEASGAVALPTTTVLSVRLDTIFVWNTVTSKWRIVGSA